MEKAVKCKIKIGKTVKHREEKDAYFIQWFQHSTSSENSYIAGKAFGLEESKNSTIKALVILADTKHALTVDPEDICFIDLPFEVV